MGVAEVTGSEARRRGLGACLRAYRRLVDPAAVGLPAGGRRRVPGLRREELATLSGVGLTWYTWLEQGRVNVSGQVIESVGRVLGLDEVARRHLRRLGAPDAPAVAPPDPGLRELLESWPDSPAALLDHRLDLVAANVAWATAWGDPEELSPSRRHAVWQLAASDVGQALLKAVAIQFRMAADMYPDDPRIGEIRAILRADFPQLVPVWECRGIGAFGTPEVDLGRTRARAHLLRPDGTGGATILVISQR